MVEILFASSRHRNNNKIIDTTTESRTESRLCLGGRRRREDSCRHFKFREQEPLSILESLGISFRKNASDTIFILLQRDNMAGILLQPLPQGHLFLLFVSFSFLWPFRRSCCGSFGSHARLAVASRTTRMSNVRRSDIVLTM